MKKLLKSGIAIMLMLTIALTVASCKKADLWNDATYTEDTTLGQGEKTLVVEVAVDEHLVTFTVKTDKDTVGDALLEQKLIKGEEGQYGLYIKEVNGMYADADKGGYYWAFYIDGEYAMTGVDSTEITEGAVYKLEYARG